MIAAYNALSPTVRAMSMMLGAMFCFTLMGIFIKLSAEHVPVMEIVFLRNFLAILIIVPFVVRSGVSSIKMNRPKLYFGRAFINFIGMFSGFTAVTLIPLAENTALSFTTPIFVTIGAVIFLGEVIRFRRIMAIIIGFIGALIILQPGFTEISLGAILSLVSAFSIAMAVLLVKKMTASETSTSIVFWMVAMQAPIALVPAVLIWEWPNLTGWVYIWGVTIFGTIAHVLFTKACGMVEVTSLQPLEFAKLPFAVVLAWAIFDEWPGLWIWVGGAIIFAATAYITRREALARQSLKPNHEKKQPPL